MTTKRKWHWRAMMLFPVYVFFLAQVPVISAHCSTTLQQQKSLTTKLITILYNQGIANNVFLPSSQLDGYSGIVESRELIRRYITSTVFDSSERINVDKNRTAAAFRFAATKFLHIDALRIQPGIDGAPFVSIEFLPEWNRLFTAVIGGKGITDISDSARLKDLFLSFLYFTGSYPPDRGPDKWQVRANRFRGTLIILKTQLVVEQSESRWFSDTPSCAKAGSDAVALLEQSPETSAGRSALLVKRNYGFASASTHLRKILVELNYTVEDWTSLGGRWEERGRAKRSIGPRPLHKHAGGAIYTSIMTVMQKRVTDWESSVPRPIMLLVWVTIIGMGVLLTLVLGVIKIVTMSAPDQSWHECIIQQLLDILYTYEKKEKPSSRWSDTVESDVAASVEPERGKSSKRILQATIRAVSFILVAFYEGNLYNSITISKTGAVSSALDDTLAIGRRIKLYGEPEGIHNLTLQFYKGSGQGFRLPARLPDCISWTDRGFRGGCVAYEFDPTSLQTGNGKYRFQKQELWKKFPSVHMKRPGHPIASLIQPLAQFCQWLVETWTFHAWNSLEKMFYVRRNMSSVESDSIDFGKLNSNSMLGIRDYFGLLFIYVFLSFSAVVVFFGEIGFCWFRAWLEGKSLKGMRETALEYGYAAAFRARNGWNALKQAVKKRRRSCLKVKRLVSNIV